MILDRERNRPGEIDAARDVGSGNRLIGDGDVAAR